MEALLPNLRHLRALCEVARQGSISRAAEQVFLSQPAVTQAISKLEAALDSALFERVGSGISPTAAGRIYVERVQRALGLIEGGVGEAIRVAGGRGARSGKEVFPLLTMTQLRDFVAVGSTNSFTLAARLVGSSQSSVHRSSRELEALLKVALFEKTTRGIVLSRAGQGLWQQLKLAFAELRQGLADVKAYGGVNLGSIVIGCLPLARHFVMPETLCEFSRHYPSVHIQLIESPYPDLLHGLRHGEIDFLIGALRNPPPSDDVVQEALFSAALCIAARPGHPLAGKAGICAADLAAYPWVVPMQGTPTRDRFERLMAGQAAAGGVGLIETSSQILIRGLLRGSDRLSLLSRPQVQFEIEIGQLVALDFAIGDTLRDIGLTFRHTWQPTAIQQAFLDQLRQTAARHTEG